MTVVTCGSKDPFQNRKEIDRDIVTFWSENQGWSKEKIISYFFERRLPYLSTEYKEFIGL